MQISIFFRFSRNQILIGKRQILTSTLNINMDNIAEQQQEIEALESIYPDEWRQEVGTDVSYSIVINPEVKLFITLNVSYPSKGPPTYQLLAPRLSKSTKCFISSAFDEIYLNNIGQPVLFQWIDKLKEIVENDIQEIPEDITGNVEIEAQEERSTDMQNFSIVHGPVIVDRKSRFQGHVCQVKSEIEVKSVLNALLANKKIAQATHNIQAYRVEKTGGVLLKDCNDDGETHAGSRLMHLLDILGVKNVFVVVTRWYGGVHLGPDRFRHINNAARQALSQAGYIE